MYYKSIAKIITVTNGNVQQKNKMIDEYLHTLDEFFTKKYGRLKGSVYPSQVNAYRRIGTSPFVQIICEIGFNYGRSSIN